MKQMENKGTNGNQTKTNNWKNKTLENIEQHFENKYGWSGRKETEKGGAKRRERRTAPVEMNPPAVPSARSTVSAGISGPGGA